MHIRRRFFEAYESMGKAGEAGHMLELLKERYTVERRLREKRDDGCLNDETFTVTRAVAMAPILANIKSWLDDKNGSVPPKTNLGKAISYALEQWPKASRFVDHPLLRPDTNLAENQIRPFVEGCKGGLFIDSPSGAVSSVAYYGLLATAQLNGHDPVLYRTYLFDQLATRPDDAMVEDLLPYNLVSSVLKPVKMG